MRFSAFFRTRKGSTPTEMPSALEKSSPVVKPEYVWHRDLKTAMENSKPPETQNILLLKEPKQDYQLEEGADVPQLESEHEVLLHNKAIGLNPIDWKGPAFNFGLPNLPCISGREMVGRVVKTSKTEKRLSVGDIVLAVSTDYRDSRKGAFQEYAVAYEYNSVRIPQHIELHDVAPMGVGFVTALMSLGICLGIDFTQSVPSPGPDFLKAVRSIPEQSLPEDTREESLRGISLSERPRPGDWIAIWGASSTVGFMALQLAKLAKLRVICIVDAIKHGHQLVEAGADMLVHRHNTEEAVSIVRAVTNGNLRFGLDAVGKETAGLLQTTLRSSEDANIPKSHLTGLTGVPKEALPGIVHHKVPIKLFHEIPQIGRAAVSWLEDLLNNKQLQPPKIVVRNGGLKGVNDALNHLRGGSFEAQRIVVHVQ